MNRYYKTGRLGAALLWAGVVIVQPPPQTAPTGSQLLHPMFQDHAVCRWAESRVQGTSVVLLNAGNATCVRYAWGESPVGSLYDDSGLPAGPFEAMVR